MTITLSECSEGRLAHTELICYASNVFVNANQQLYKGSQHLNRSRPYYGRRKVFVVRRGTCNVSMPSVENCAFVEPRSTSPGGNATTHSRWPKFHLVSNSFNERSSIRRATHNCLRNATCLRRRRAGFLCGQKRSPSQAQSQGDVR